MFEIMGTLALSFSCSGIPNLEAGEEFDPSLLFERINVTTTLDTEQLSVEETWQFGEFCLINVIGNDWHKFAYAVVQQAPNIEFYGSLMADYGTEFYFALNEDGQRHFSVFDPENDNFSQHPQVIWETMLPPEIIDEVGCCI